MSKANNTLKKKEYKYKYSSQLQKVVRKNAHYFLYMLGGILLSVFFYAKLYFIYLFSKLYLI